MATSYSQLGILAADRGDAVAEILGWHARALGIRLRMGVPEAMNNLRRLAVWRRELGNASFAEVLDQVTDDTELTEVLPGLLDQLDAAEDKAP